MPAQGARPNATQIRQTERHTVRLPGKVVSRDGDFSADCVVREIGTAGARIEVQPGRLLPLRFYLLAAKLVVAYEAEVIWSWDHRAGLRFLGILDFSDADSRAPRFLKRLHCELCPRETGGE